jgi:ATP-dependent DNA helicase RecG
LDLEERLASLISDSIAPRLVPELEIRRWRRPHVIAVQMHPSAARPHNMKRDGPERGADN